MNFISKAIKDLREQYKRDKENKTTIELMYRAKAIKEGSAKNGV